MSNLITVFATTLAAISAAVSALAAVYSVKLAVRAMQGNHLPILLIHDVSFGEYADGSVKIKIHFTNQGTGLAKNIEYNINDTKVVPTDEFVMPAKAKIPADNILISPMVKGTTPLRLKMTYRDVYDNAHRTFHRLNWEIDRYTLDRTFNDFE